MASNKTPLAWERAVQLLTSYPSKFSGIGDHIFPILKFSYDSLGNDTIKSCFRYCSMWPEDYEIEEEELIQLWIGEGFLDEFDGIHEARNQGREMITSLKLACLLEEGESGGSIKMHDIIRDMALWLSCDYGEEKHKFFVRDELTKAHEIVKWKDAQRIFSCHSGIDKEFTESLCFPNLITLILKKLDIVSFPNSVFGSMPVIRVLDLSMNHDLAGLPSEIGTLVSLQYLNLPFTGIKEIPVGLKTLTKLRCLILDHMYSLKVISLEVISSLSSLRLFSMLGRNKQDLLKELECLPHINELSIDLSQAPPFEHLLASPKLQAAIRALHLKVHRRLKTVELCSSIVRAMTHLEWLALRSCRDLEEVKIGKDMEEEGSVPCYIPNLSFCSLNRVDIFNCPNLLHLSWLVYAPSLEALNVHKCEMMEEVIPDDKCGGSEIEEENLRLFSRLRVLVLMSLDRLMSICRRPLPFPSLTTINVRWCPSLKKLPLNCNSATKSLKQIEGSQSWWDGLEWEDESIKRTFTPYFSESIYG